jgi:hypothetical protein
MNESDLSGKFMSALKTRGFHGTRVENVQGSGTPDINFAKLRAQGWVETKTAKGSWLYFELYQIPWFISRLRATNGRFVWVLAEIAGYAYLFNASTITAAKREPHKKWVRIKVADIIGEAIASTNLERPSWDLIIDVLADEH